MVSQKAFSITQILKMISMEDFNFHCVELTQKTWKKPNIISIIEIQLGIWEQPNYFLVMVQ